MGSQSTPLAAVQFALLGIPARADLAARVFDVLEYGPEWGSDELQQDLSDVFARDGVLFSDPSDMPPGYRYNAHRSVRGQRCAFAGKPTTEPRQNPDGAFCPLRCPGGYIEAIPHGEEPATAPPDTYVTVGNYAWWLEGPTDIPIDHQNPDGYTLWMAPASGGHPDLSVASRAEDVEDWAGTQWAGTDGPSDDELRTLKASLLVVTRAGTERQPEPAPAPKPEPSGWVTVSIDDGRGAHFRIQDGDLVETVDELGDGSPDWDAAVECVGSGHPEVIAAILRLLRFANGVGEPETAAVGNVLSARADVLFQRARGALDKMAADPAFQSEATSRRYRAAMRGFLGGPLGDFAAALTPDVLTNTAALVKAVALDPAASPYLRVLAGNVVDEFFKADSDDDQAFWDER